MTEMAETAKKIKVLIVDDIQQTRVDIRRLLYFEDDLDVCGEAENGEEALAAVARYSPDVVLMDINMPVMDGITATQALSHSHPHVPVVIISIQGEQEYLRKAMVAGARDYLVKPLSSEEMALTIRQCYHLHQRNNHLHPSPGGPGAREGTDGKGDVYKHKVITFFGGKGGSGKSFLAGNLAVALAKKKLKTALVDLDLQFGDIAVIFNLAGTNTISDLVAQGAGFGAEQLAGCLIRHASGVSVLAAPFSPAEAEKITAEHVKQIIRMLKGSFDCVVLDTAAFLHEITLLALEESELILLPARRDIATIKNARVSLDLLNSLELGDKVRVLLNQANLDTGIELAELEHSLGSKIYHSVAGDERMVIASINRGIPLVMEHGSSEIARDLSRLAEKVCNGFTEEIKTTERKVSLGKIFSLNFG
ncbi:MAG TPA: histidine kinase [Firmicutes bacterium]|nr:histidine kinase [Bacillota bacterium]